MDEVQLNEAKEIVDSFMLMADEEGDECGVIENVEAPMVLDDVQNEDSLNLEYSHYVVDGVVEPTLDMEFASEDDARKSTTPMQSKREGFRVEKRGKGMKSGENCKRRRARPITREGCSALMTKETGLWEVIDTHGEPFPLAPEAVHQSGRAPLLATHSPARTLTCQQSCQLAGSLPNPYSCKAVGYSSSCHESPHPGLRLSVVTMLCKFHFIARHPLGFSSISVSHPSFDGTSSIDYVTVIARLRRWFQLGMGKILLPPFLSWG
ncbi:hypothetical protein Acr_27g0010000 [Actinidia rufa]|uniref:Uncharacterized protein n=1 Tax=Actinidia rufa TaxID=165716 RepID=A0A7J0H8G5_9ERIC|nr:hypothetical protein Acr_27g0010000 [Actinidia rufa]